MKFSEIRSYLKERVEETDSNFYEWLDGYNFENVPSVQFDMSYHITLNSPTIVTNQTNIEIPVSIIVQFGFSGENSVQNKIFTSMDLVSDVKMNILNREKLELFMINNSINDPMISIEANSQVHTSLPTNDDRFKITLTMTGRTFRTYCN